MKNQRLKNQRLKKPQKSKTFTASPPQWGAFYFMKGKTMGKKKKAILRNKRLGNLGKYTSKFSALIKNAPKGKQAKVEEVTIEEDEKLIQVEEPPVVEPEVEEEPKQIKKKRATKKTSTTKVTTRKSTPKPKKTTATTRKRRTTKAKAET